MMGNRSCGFTARHLTLRIIVCVMMTGLILIGCRSTSAQSGRTFSSWQQPRIRRVACLYEQRPWLTMLDRAGDQDPEGIHYRVFLDPGTGRGILVEGTFRIEMYLIERKDGGHVERTMVSDWIYPTRAINTLRSKILGKGYHLYLRWHSKDFAGHEVEFVTQFEDPDGRIARAGTKRFSIPKYSF